MSFAEFFTQHAKYQKPMATRTQYYQPLCQMFLLELPLHYENLPIQIYWKFYHQNMKIFR